ncbi:hypothetical protein B4146_0850 [Bacillus subtilis]|nr:hypothetical protein B4146_0850 [Bacillus subtilis]
MRYMHNKGKSRRMDIRRLLFLWLKALYFSPTIDENGV